MNKLNKYVGETNQMDCVQNGRCLIIGAGDLTLTEIPKKESDLVIAVDGGLTYCNVLGIEPDMILGDFDSVSQKEYEKIEELKKQIPNRIIQLNKEKDDTDMFAAIKYGLEKGYQSFQIYAGTGGRLEHTIANIQCLLYLKKQGAVGYLMDGNGMIFVLKNEEVRFQKNMEGYLSLFTLGTEAKGVTIQGMKYPLQDYTICNDMPIGISNEFIGEEGVVRVTDGELVGIINYITE